MPCHVEWRAQHILGRTSDVSWEGITVSLNAPIELNPEEAVDIFITPQGEEEEIVLRVQPIHAEPWRNLSKVGFKVVRVEHGEHTWHQFCYVPSW